MRAFVFGMLIAVAGCAPAAEDTSPLVKKGDIDYACTTDADCAVKDVGSCCGYKPACVNKDSPTFPEQVKAECEAQGMSSICGFEEISACQCVENRCAAEPSTGVPSAQGRKD